ncbi:hypothetical protein BASA83_001736 [Batrachochytrium salamandrivorans]|nr:hypothetical protein BASA83_001736 [Batrachochytrium salamandrivorans]
MSTALSSSTLAMPRTLHVVAGVYERSNVSCSSPSPVNGTTPIILIPLAYTPYLYWLAGLLLIITSSFQAFSTVFIESYFPILLRNDPSVKHYRMPAKFDGDPTSTSARSTSKELGRQVTESGMIIQSTVLKTYPFDERGNWVQMYSNIYGFSTSFVILTIGGGLIMFWEMALESRRASFVLLVYFGSDSAC